MSLNSLFSISQSPESSTENPTNRDDSDVKVVPPDNRERNSPSQTRESTPGRTTSPTALATRPASREPSELTMWAAYIDDSVFENEPSVTLQGEIPELASDVDKDPLAIPPIIVPGLLQGVNEVSPSRLILNREGSKVHEADEDSDGPGDELPLYSAMEKEKWKAQADDNDIYTGWVGRSSADFELETPDNTVEEWVMGTKSALQEYEDRQVSLPVGPRLEITNVDESSEFVLGVLKLLANRDPPGCTNSSRQLDQFLIENFVDVKKWAKDYFRSKHAIQDVESSVLTLLTIILNNFCHAQVQLIDQIVEFALKNMRNSGRISLKPGDFAFGFDFRMSQNLPFAVETSSKIRKDANPVSVAETPLTSEPVVTHSGRQVKPTERARATFQKTQPNQTGKRDKDANSSQPKDKEAAKGTIPCGGRKKGSTQPTCQRAAKATSTPSPDAVKPAPVIKTTSERSKHRPTRPSNLGSSTSGSTRSRSEDSSKSEHRHSASADSPKVSGPKGSRSIVNSTPRLRIIIPATRLRTSSTPAMGGLQSALGIKSGRTSQLNPSADAGGTTMHGTSHPGIARPRGHPSGRGRGHGSGRKRNVTLTRSTDSSTAYPHAVDNSSGDDTPTPQNAQKSELLPPQTDPGHPQGKKRKLDDCED